MEKIVLTSDIESIRFEKDNGGAGGTRLRIGQGSRLRPLDLNRITPAEGA